jgi:hypothetical protein
MKFIQTGLLFAMVCLLFVSLDGIGKQGEDKQNIRQQGLRAERAGLTASDNPYTGSRKVEWLNGYIDGREARMKRMGLLQSDDSGNVRQDRRPTR